MDDSDDFDLGCVFPGAVSDRQATVDFDTSSDHSTWVTQYLDWSEGGSGACCSSGGLGVPTQRNVSRTQTPPNRVLGTGIEQGGPPCSSP